MKQAQVAEYARQTLPVSLLAYEIDEPVVILASSWRSTSRPTVPFS